MKSTEKLILECLDFKRSSQNELYHRYADQVMNVAKRYLKDEYKAKDVFLSSFEKILNNIAKYDKSKGSFESWISRITINESLNSIRKEKRISFTEIDYQSINIAKVEAVDNLDYQHIKEIINNLKMPYGLIFNMVQDGYKHKEISQQLNINEATSRSYYKRSREMIQNQLVNKYEL